MVRNAVVDGILHLLRSVRDSGVAVRGVIAYGEAAFHVMAALRTIIREEAYVKRGCA